MLGTKETQEMLDFVLGLGNALGKSLVDGKVGIGDVHNFVAPLMTAGNAFNNAVGIPAELRDLSAVEKEALLARVKQKFDLPDDKLEAIVENSLEILGHIHALVLKFKEI